MLRSFDPKGLEQQNISCVPMGRSRKLFTATMSHVLSQLKETTSPFEGIEKTKKCFIVHVNAIKLLKIWPHALVVMLTTVIVVFLNLT